MSETLVVHVNRDRPQSIALDAGSFESAGSFAVAVRNHGRPVHVHLNLDDALSTVAHIEAGNHYVDGDSTTKIPVTVEGSQRPVSGKLKVSTGYGARTEYVHVELVDPATTDEHVRVDETLSKPQGRSADANDGPLGGDSPVVRNAPIAALGGFALVLAVVVASMVSGGTAVVGALAVVVGVAVAAYLLVVR